MMSQTFTFKAECEYVNKQTEFTWEFPSCKYKYFAIIYSVLHSRVYRGLCELPVDRTGAG